MSDLKLPSETWIPTGPYLPHSPEMKTLQNLILQDFPVEFKYIQGTESCGSESKAAV